MSTPAPIPPSSPAAALLSRLTAIHRWDWKGPVKVAAATLGVSLLLALVFGLITKPYGSDVHWGFKSLFAWLAWGWESIFGVSATGSLDMHGSGSIGSFSGAASGSAHASLGAAPLTLTVVTFAVAARVFRSAIRRCAHAFSATLLGLRAALLIALPLGLVSLVATLNNTDLARLALLPATADTHMRFGRADVSLRWSDSLTLSSVEAFLIVLLAMTAFFAALTIGRADWFQGRILLSARRLLLAPLRAFGKLSVALVVAGLIFTFVTVLIRWNSASELHGAPVPSLSTHNWIILAFALVAYAGNFGVAALGLGSWGQFGGNADVAWSGNIPFGFQPGSVTCSVQHGIDWWAQTEVTLRTNPCSGFHQPTSAAAHFPVLDWGVWTAAIVAPLVLLYVASSIVKANGTDPKAKLLSLGTWLLSLLVVLPFVAYLAQVSLSGDAAAAGTIIGADLSASGEATATLGLSSATPFIIAGYAGLFAALVALRSGAINVNTFTGLGPVRTGPALRRSKVTGMTNLRRVIVVGFLGLALAGCGSTGSTPDPSTTDPASVGVSLEPAPTATTSTPTTPTLTATPTTGPVVLRWPGDGIDITIDNASTALNATTPEFQAFIAKQLDDIWNGWGGPSCRSSAHIYLGAYTSAGFALVNNEGMFGEQCAGGGNAAIYAKVAGTWKEAIGTQEAFPCSALTRLKFPADLATITCMNTDGTTRAYAG